MGLDGGDLTRLGRTVLVLKVLKNDPLVNMIFFETVAVGFAVHAGLAGADGQGGRTAVNSILAACFAGLAVKAFRRWRRRVRRQ